eukprot:CCRYP_003682-RA/>CCRYP_003682-RA protein AED:0.04 eAED:0.03 QI:0/-1/0/1/-1/1/1/0/217
MQPLDPIRYTQNKTKQNKDNQEVYQDCTEETGAVLVVEILQYQSDIANGDAASFFFRDLAESNECCDADCDLYSSTVLSLCGTEDGWKENDAQGEIQDGGNLIRQLSENMNLSFGNASRICCIIVVGSQKVVQGKDVVGTDPSTHTHDAAKCIDVEMCILRLEQVETDLLITLSTPSDSTSIRSGDNGKSVTEQATVGDVFREIVSSVRIQDWTLFG